jgi:hypothetical protein
MYCVSFILEGEGYTDFSDEGIELFKWNEAKFNLWSRKSRRLENTECVTSFLCRALSAFVVLRTVHGVVVQGCQPCHLSLTILCVGWLWSSSSAISGFSPLGQEGSADIDLKVLFFLTSNLSFLLSSSYPFPPSLSNRRTGCVWTRPCWWSSCCQIYQSVTSSTPTARATSIDNPPNSRSDHTKTKT